MKQKQILSLLGLIAFYLLAFQYGQAQQSPREISTQVISKTAVTLHTGHKAVSQGQVYSGNLSKAINHQRYAIQLYRNGEYMRAVYHSRRAKTLASLAIRSNHYTATPEEIAPDGISLETRGPSDDALNAEMEAGLIQDKLIDDSKINGLDGITLGDDE